MLTSGSIIASKTTLDGDDVVFSIGSNTLRIKEGSKSRITFIDGSGNLISSERYGAAEIVNFEANTVLTGTAYADTIENWGNGVTVNAGESDDYVENIGEDVTINAGSGADTLINCANNVTLNGGAGEDYVNNSGDSVKVYGGAGNDYITSSGRKVTIEAGAGDDYIEGSSDYGDLFVYNYTDGNDVITNFDAKDTLKISSGEITGAWTVQGDGETIANYVVQVEYGTRTGTVTFQDIGSKKFETLESGGAKYVRMRKASNVVDLANVDDDVAFNADAQELSDEDANYYIENTGANVTLKPGANDDTIIGSDEYGEVYRYDANSGNDVILNFGANDSIKLDGGRISETMISDDGNDFLVTITSGSSASTITLKGAGGYKFDYRNELLTVADGITTVNRLDSVKFEGTELADKLTNNGASVTIEGKGGNDTITGSNNGELYLFGSADGYDVITNFGKNDSIKITSGELQPSAVSGNDVIFNVKGGLYNGSMTLQGAGAYNFIQNGNVLTVDEVNYVVNRTSKKVSGTSGRDYITNTVDKATIAGSAGNDTMEGSNFGEVYTFSPTHGSNVIANFGANDTLVAQNGGTLTYALSGDDDVIVTVANANATSTINLKNTSTYTWTQNGSTLTAVGSVVRQYNDTPNTVFSGTSGADYMINNVERVTIESKGGNDTIEGSDYADVYSFAYNHGNNVITNFGAGDTLRATSGTITTQKSGDDVIVTIASGSTAATVTLQDAAGLNLVQTARYIYASVDVLNPIPNDEENVTVTGTGGADYITNSSSGVTIKPNGGNDIIEGSDAYGEVFVFSYADGNNSIVTFGENDSLKISSGSLQSSVASGDDMIVSIANSRGTSIATVTLGGAAGYNFIQSGSWLKVESDINYMDKTEDNVTVTTTGGRDWVTNTGSGVTIKGSAGDDTFEGSDYGEMYAFAYNHDDNVILNFGANDSIKRTSSGTMTYSVDGDDVVVSIANSRGTSVSTVRLEGTASETFTVSGSVLTIVTAGDNTLVNTDSDIKFDGTDGDDYIINEAENVTLDGQGGNDTLEGSEEYGDVFQFDAPDGNNVITNFDDQDELRVTSGSVETVFADGTDYVVTARQGDYTGTMRILNGATTIGRKGNAFVVKDAVKNLLNRNSNVQFNGTDFNDVLTNTGTNVTLNGKSGNDTLIGSATGEVFQFSSDGGDDVITDFGVNDTLQITSGSISNTVGIDDDLLININTAVYNGSILLKGASKYKFNSEKTDEGTFLTVEDVNYVQNNRDNRSVSGKKGADYITNSGKNVTINGSAGNDTIDGSNFGELYLFSSAHNDNVITNFGANDTLRMTSGNTMTYSTVGNDVIVTLQGTSYVGTVTLLDAAGLNFAKSGSKVLYVKGVNKVVNGTDSVKVTGKSTSDYIVNSGKNVTIQGNGGDDTLVGSDAYGEVFNFSSADDNNVIMNFGKGDTLRCTAGSIKSVTFDENNNAIVSLQGSKHSGTVTLVDAGALIERGYTLVQSGKYVTVDAVNDINNGFDEVKVSGTNDKDYITNSGENVTIEGLGGSDTIEGSIFGEVFAFSSAHGNNLITNFGLNDTLRCTAGSIATVMTVGNDAVVSLKGTKYSGTVTLGGAGSYNFTQSGRNLYVKGINDITNHTNNVKVPGTSKADYIFNDAEGVTIQAGRGNDTITGSDEYKDVFAFSSADDDNIITNFSAGDTLKLTSGNTITFEQSGNDYVVTLQGSKYTGHVTLEGAVANGTLKKSGSKALIMTANRTTSAELPSDDYWFMDEEYTASATANEIDELIAEPVIDNATALTEELFADVKATRFEEMTALTARRKTQK